MDKEKKAAYARKYRAKTKEKRAAYNRKWRAENKEKATARERKYRAENKEKMTAYNRKWRAENKEKAAARAREYWDTCAVNLTDTYIRRVLTTKSPLTAEDIPIELIALKREDIRLKRLIKEKKDE